MRRSEAITQFLKSATCPIAKLYSSAMEVQVMVAQDHGVRYKGTSSGVSWQGFVDPDDDKHIWKNFRMPLSANTDTPRDNDGVMTFDLREHVEGVGMTGFDWKNKLTRWVGFDFDSIVNHKLGLAKADLDDLINKCTTVEGLTILRSTSGSGYHIYLIFDEPIPCNNHNEHAAIARSFISVLTVATGFDFQAKVDCVGSILWVWHRKQEGTNGLSILKDGGLFPARLLPKNWKEHLSVIAGKAKRTPVTGDVNSLISAMKDRELDTEHRRVLLWLQKNAKYTFYWDQDHGLLVAHTLDLKEAHKSMELRGLYDSDSSGSSDYNCFAFPIANGAWIVRRFGKNVQENTAWVIDESGWCKTYYNDKPTLERACRFFGGLEDRSGAYVFVNLEQCVRALTYVDLDLQVPPEMYRAVGDRPVAVEYSQKKSKVFVSFPKAAEDKNYHGWLCKPKSWERVLRYSEDAVDSSALSVDIDDWVRHTVSAGSTSGWFISCHGEWIQQSDGAISKALCALIPEADASELKQIEGKALLNPWKFDNAPFEDEYPGGRIWNKQGSKFAFEPVAGLTPTWDDLFNHVGKALTEPVMKNVWCREQGIYTGGDYLRYWVASVCQRPSQQLPYLFLCGEQKTGKTTFHLAIEKLFLEGRGYMFADSALKNPTGFNDELYGAVVCVIEEVDLSKSRNAYNRLKDWVTADTFAVNTKYKNIFKATSYMHFIQCANSPRNVPVFEGDTRVVMIPVYTLQKETPKELFKSQLLEEAPAALYNFLNMPLGKPESRLGMPVLETALKQSVIQSNYTVLERYLAEECVTVAGYHTDFTLFGHDFRNWLIDNNYLKYLEEYEQHKLQALFPERGTTLVAQIPDGTTVVSNLLTKSRHSVPELQAMIEEGREELRLTEEGFLC